MNIETQYDLTIRKGDSFDLDLYYKADGTPVDLTGYTAEMTIVWPDTYRPGGAPVAAGEVNATMTVTGAAGRVQAHLTPANTTSLPEAPVLCSWQLRIKSGGDPIQTLIAGGVIVTPDLFAMV